jgi:citrate lyase beta subunit
MTVKQAILAELIYDCVSAYAKLWDTTQHAQAVLAAIERAKTECADTADEQDRMVDELTADAWRRLAAERAIDDADDLDQIRASAP